MSLKTSPLSTSRFFASALSDGTKYPSFEKMHHVVLYTHTKNKVSPNQNFFKIHIYTPPSLFLCFLRFWLNQLYSSPSTGTPAPDFPSGPSESEHLGHWMPDYFKANISLKGQRAIGLARFDYEQQRVISEGERKMLTRANEILGFQ